MLKVQNNSFVRVEKDTIPKILSFLMGLGYEKTNEPFDQPSQLLTIENDKLKFYPSYADVNDLTEIYYPFETHDEPKKSVLNQPIQSIVPMMFKSKCRYLATQEDRNDETVISFCMHSDNPEDTEGNCRTEICPLLDETEEHY